MNNVAQKQDNTNCTWQSILWRNLIYTGHDACRLYSTGGNWHFDGTAVFTHETKPSHLSYHVVCNEDWSTISAIVKGWSGRRLVSIELFVDTDQRWWRNGSEVPEVAGSIDLDLNFSPSTNTIAIRRLKLDVGEQKKIIAAWLRFPSFALEPLPQSYQRLEKHLYRYESGGGNFITDLHTNSTGFVTDYPGVWISESYASE